MSVSLELEDVASSSLFGFKMSKGSKTDKISSSKNYFVQKVFCIDDKPIISCSRKHCRSPLMTSSFLHLGKAEPFSINCSAVSAHAEMSGRFRETRIRPKL